MKMIVDTIMEKMFTDFLDFDPI